MPLSPSVRDYLTRVARLDVGDLVSWRAWCGANRDELERRVGRQGFLKLKFSPRASLPSFLEREGIDFDRGALMTLLLDADAGLEWDAQPIDTFGVRELYERGGDAEADAIIAGEVATLAASEHAGLLLGELVMGAEWLHRRGETRYALGIARAVAGLPRRDDLLDPAIAEARAFVHRVEPQ